MSLLLQNRYRIVIIILIAFFFGKTAFAQDEALSNQSSTLLEVFLSSRVSLSNKVPLHFTGIKAKDSHSDLDTLSRVLTRDLTLSGLFNLRLPNFPPDTSETDPLSMRMTYLNGTFSAESPLIKCTMYLSMPYGADPYWSEEYEFDSGRARTVAHRISSDVIRILTGEPSVMQTRIAYCVQFGNAKELLSTTFDGFDKKRHTTQGVPMLSPAWSPDGQFIAYTSFLKNQADIYIVDLSNGLFQPFVEAPGVDQAPDWSPDGQWIVYSSSVDGNAEIYRRSVDGLLEKRLTFSWAIETSPNWSPTGQEITFVSDRLGHLQVFIMDSDGANQRRLTWDGTYNASPVWSPRGDLIAYVRRDMDGYQIFVTDPRGNQHVKLTSGPGNNMDPCWSPDGLKLAFTSNRTGREQVYTMDLYGRHVTRISDSKLPSSSPTWSPVLDHSYDLDISAVNEFNQYKQP